MMSPLSSLLNLNIGMPGMGCRECHRQGSGRHSGVAATPGVTESETHDF
jgi:hypothetical protein